MVNFMSSENKQTLLFRLYQILFDYSDCGHPLTQQQIIGLLQKHYGVEVERMAIGRNISYLREMGFEIHSDRNGSYLEERPLESSELRLLIDGVLASRHINAGYSKEIIGKLVRLGGANFKAHVKHIYAVNDWGKSENKELFLNIDLVDEAIERHRRIIFTYIKLGTDKQAHKTHHHIVSPYQMILHNQRYYLVAYNEYWKGMRFYRLDKMMKTEILDEAATPLRSVPGYENGLNYSELANAHPYMYADKPEKITLRCDVGLTDELADWFGRNFVIKGAAGETDDKNAEKDHRIIVEVTSSPQAMVYWALQFGDNAEVLEPQSVRRQVKEKLRQILQKYE